MEETIDAFIMAFGTLGYQPCIDGSLEDGFEKVVIYTLNDKPTHMTGRFFQAHGQVS